MSHPVKTTAEIRESFLNYFESKGHKRAESASLIPINDPTLLFVNAGMVPFKDYFLGLDEPKAKTMTSTQRCVRAGGKHNDLENVGYTARHHTFFEMLGNFSFGEYFKKEAIAFAWDFLTNVLHIPKERLWVSVYKDDQESADIWIKDIGVDPNRISYCGKKDNFWSMGDTGPCGPCSEIFYDHGEDIAGGPPGTPEEDGDRYIEIWNMVFMQFNRLASGQLEKLPVPCVDTGMGLERISAVLQDVHNNYDIDLFQHLIKAFDALFSLQNNNDIKTKRVIADHIRSTAFLIADGISPSNEGRGYVLRRIIRRAVRHGFQLGLSKPFFYKMVAPLVAIMGDAYPLLRAQQDYIEQIILSEEQQFAKTLSKGMKVLEQAIAKMDGHIISGELAFMMYDTYGFPLDLTADIAREKDLFIDMDGFEQHMQKQREQSKKASTFSQTVLSATHLTDQTEFLGYEETQCEAITSTLLQDGSPVSMLQNQEKGCVILNQTPFYPQGGGQVADTGVIQSQSGIFEVTDVQKQGQAILHYGQLKEGFIQPGDEVNAQIYPIRDQIAANHSATHLLHAALQGILGDHVQQKGSLVNADYLRFDFSHHQPLTDVELKQIEDLVNEKIRDNLPATIEWLPIEEAKEKGAMALFGEKYGDEVRVLTFGDFSIELCGGIHVDATGDIGLFKLVKEEGIAAGVRRIEALTGQHALDHVYQTQKKLQDICNHLQVDKKQVLYKIEQQQEAQKTMQHELNQLKAKQLEQLSKDLMEQAQEVNQVSLIMQQFTQLQNNDLKLMVDHVKAKANQFVMVLVNQLQDKSQLLVAVSDDLTPQLNANVLLKEILEPLGGRGGGKPVLAQGSFDHHQADVNPILSVFSDQLKNKL